MAAGRGGGGGGVVGGLRPGIAGIGDVGIGGAGMGEVGSGGAGMGDVGRGGAGIWGMGVVGIGGAGRGGGRRFGSGGAAVGLRRTTERATLPPCCTTWDSSWASRWAPSLRDVSGTPSRKKMSLPRVNAFADMPLLRSLASLPVCTRTAEKSAPKAPSMSRRTSEGRLRPPERAAVMRCSLSADTSPPPRPIAVSDGRGWCGRATYGGGGAVVTTLMTQVTAARRRAGGRRPGRRAGRPRPRPCRRPRRPRAWGRR